MLALSIGASGCSPRREPSPNETALGEMAKARLMTVQGETRSLNDYRGKIVMLHFFSSWCLECGLEAPTLRNLSLGFKDSPFAIVGIAVDDDPYQMKAFVSKFQLPFPVLLDSTGEFKTFFQVKELPVTLFLGKDGVPLRFQDPRSGEATAQIVGARQWDTVKPVEMIAQLLENL